MRKICEGQRNDGSISPFVVTGTLSGDDEMCDVGGRVNRRILFGHDSNSKREQLNAKLVTEDVFGLATASGTRTAEDRPVRPRK